MIEAEELEKWFMSRPLTNIQPTSIILAVDTGGFFVSSEPSWTSPDPKLDSEGKLLTSSLPSWVRHVPLCSRLGGKIFCSNGTHLTLLSSTLEEEVVFKRTYKGPGPRIIPNFRAVCVVPVKERTLVVGGDGAATLWVWDLQSPSEPLKIIPNAHRQSCLHALAVPGTRFFLTSGYAQIKIWDSESLECVAIHQLWDDPQFGSAVICPLSPPSTLAVISCCTYLTVYDGIPELKERASLYVPNNICGILKVAPGKILMPADEKNLKIWNFRDVTQQSIDLELGKICCLQKLANGNILIRRENELLILHMDKMMKLSRRVAR
jgi:WD40 repeat protein